MRKLLIIVISLAITAGNAYASEPLVIAGAGPSTELVKLLVREFCGTEDGKGFHITVPPKSIKHAGGLRWATGKDPVFGRTGRPMNDKEKKTYPQLREFFLAKIKIGFAVNKKVSLSKLTGEQFEGIFTGKIKNWKAVGGADMPVILLGREKTEAAYTALCKDYPFMLNARFVRRYKKEHQIIKAISRTPGSIGFSSESVIRSEKKCILLDIEGFSSGQNVGLVYDVQKEKLPIVDKVRRFVNGERWLNVLKSSGYLPPEKR
ncbi:substrate-binding domain-containing protein [Desulfobacterales bacterium HSG2]|nr:substrate-binding domain-containing protein [Desulfobacterales bacterium HSG2]